MYDLIIVGGGPGALGAAIYAARAKLNTILIAKEIGGYLTQTDKIENYLGFKNPSGLELKNAFEDHVKSYNLKIIEDQEVSKIYETNGLINCELEDETIITCKYAIVATGSKRKKLGVKGEKEFLHKGVTYCAVCDGPVFQDQNVAVIGGSYSGTKSALYLSNIANKVYLLEIDKLKGEALLIDQIRNNPKIEIIENAKTLEIYGSDYVEGLKYEKNNNIEKIELQGISIEIGLIPSSDLVDVKKNADGKIIVDDYMMTSNKKIFAVGDVNDKNYEQIIIAAAQGCIAALKINEVLK